MARDDDFHHAQPEPEPDEVEPTDNSTGTALDDRQVTEVEEETREQRS